MANLYKRTLTSLVSTVSTTVFTVPVATSAVVKSIMVSNSNAAATTAEVVISPTGVGTHIIIPAESIASMGYVDFAAGWDRNPNVLVLEAGDLLKIKVTTTDVVATVSVLLIDRN